MFVTEGKNVRSFDVKVVFVHSRAKRKEWIAFACTDTSLTYEQLEISVGGECHEDIQYHGGLHSFKTLHG